MTSETDSLTRLIDDLRGLRTWCERYPTIIEHLDAAIEETRYLAVATRHFEEKVRTGTRIPGYTAHRFIQWVEEHGPFGAAVLALQPPDFPLQSGLARLHELGQLPLSAEYLALLPWHRVLFTDDQLRRAEVRLVSLEFPIDERMAQESAPDWYRGF